MGESSRERDGFAVIPVTGRLNLRTAGAFRQRAAEALADGQPRLPVDLDEAESVHSSGLGAIVWAARRGRDAEGELRILRANERIMALPERTNVATVVHAEAKAPRPPETEGAATYRAPPITMHQERGDAPGHRQGGTP